MKNFSFTLYTISRIIDAITYPVEESYHSFFNIFKTSALVIKKKKEKSVAMHGYQENFNVIMAILAF